MKNSTDWKNLESRLAETLKPGRYRHTLGVAYTAAALAMRYGADMERARLAGLLHDCAKCMSPDKMRRLAVRKHLGLSDFELAHDPLLHAGVGAYVAEKEYGIKDPEILSSIRWHTTGKPEMTLLEKIIYIADYIEPNRDRAPRLPELRVLAFKDLDVCMAEILRNVTDYLSDSSDEMDSTSMRAYDYYARLAAGSVQPAVQAAAQL